jgi:predicted chitinase
MQSRFHTTSVVTGHSERKDRDRWQFRASAQVRIAGLACFSS